MRSVDATVKVLRVIGTLEKAAILIVMLTMAVILIYEVFAREVLGHGVLGGPQLATYLMIWGAYLGFSYATTQGAHIRPRFADGWMPRAWRPAIKRIGHVISGLILCVLGAAAVVFVRDSFQFRETASTLGWYTWWVQIIMPLAFFVTALRHFCYAAFIELEPVESEFAQ